MAKKKTLKQRAKKLTLTHRYQGGFKGSDGKIYTKEQGQALLMSKEARIAEWHTVKKNGHISYEGTQYKGGRKKGSPKLIRQSGKIINQYGVVFTEEEKKALESKANRANRKRMKMLSAEGELPRLSQGKETGETVRSLQAMGKESDFIISRKRKSLQKFKSREQFEHYMENLDQVLSPDYLKNKVKLYKRNHMKALENVFGDDAKDVIMKIRMMKTEDYMELIQKDEDLEVSYIYDPSELGGKLNRIRMSLGMKLKETPSEL